MLLGYDNAKTLSLRTKGTGGVDELKAHLDEKEVAFILIRLPDRGKDLGIQRADGLSNTKDIFLTWQGPSVRQVEKSQKTSHQGMVKQVLKPSHADVLCVNKNNLTEDTLRDRAQPMAHSHVIE